MKIMEQRTFILFIFVIIWLSGCAYGLDIGSLGGGGFSGGANQKQGRCPITLSTDKSWVSTVQIVNFEDILKDGSIVDLHILHTNGGKGTIRLVVERVSMDEITGTVRCNDTFMQYGDAVDTYHRAYIGKISVIKFDN